MIPLPPDSLDLLEVLAERESDPGRLAAMPEDFRNSSVGERIFQDIDLARSFAVDQAGNLARGRYNRLIDELGELTTQIDTVDLEVSTAMREGIAQAIREQNAERTESGGGDVVVDEEHQRWPFDGEYWRDELGFYRQQVTNQCGR